MEHPESLLRAVSHGWRTPFTGYAVATLGVGLLTALSQPLRQWVEPTNLVMLYLLLVVGVALRYSRGPAAWSAVLGVLAFDYFHVPPRLSFAVGDVQYLLTFAVMLLVGLVLAEMMARLRQRAEEAAAGERSTSRQYALARELAGAIDMSQVQRLLAAFMHEEVGGLAEVWWVNSREGLHRLAPVAGEDEQTVLPGQGETLIPALLETVLREGGPHEQDDLMRSTHRLLLLPLDAPMRRRGVLAVSAPVVRLGRAQRSQLGAVALLVAIALERLHYVKVAQQATLDMERERLRSTILSALSHDIRTPLTIMVGQADALLDADGEHARTLVLALREQTMRMSELVNNLLDMARLQSSQVALRRDWQSLEEIVGAAIAHLGERLARHTLEVVLPEDLPLVEFDAVLIERVLCNLLENAAKFSPEDGLIRIVAELQTHAVRIAVENSGVNLPGNAERFFEPFVRGDDVATVPGLGLGLSICKIIVEAHGGVLSAGNRSEGGAWFAFTLPRTPPPQLETEESVTNE
ncbi:MAG: histidine kinase [Proteobacteria bacterium]|nr:histidine kinase [Pseudomonadota bacterium]